MTIAGNETHQWDIKTGCCFLNEYRRVPRSAIPHLVIWSVLDFSVICYFECLKQNSMADHVRTMVGCFKNIFFSPVLFL